MQIPCLTELLISITFDIGLCSIKNYDDHTQWIDVLFGNGVTSIDSNCNCASILILLPTEKKRTITVATGKCVQDCN